MINEPTKSVNAVLLPSWMAPKAVQRMAGSLLALFSDKGNRYQYRKGQLQEPGN